jgi:hypothetical protein
MPKVTKSESGKLGWLASRETQARLLSNRKAAYSANPTKCACCEKRLPYSKRKNKYCSRSCAAQITNRTHPKRSEEISKACPHCGETIPPSKNENTYCSSGCFQEHRFQARVDSGTASATTMKRWLIRTYGNKCMRCGWAEVNPYSHTVPVEIEHKDGNSDNNSKKNVELLCPNCHSLTKTFRALNRGNGRHARMRRYRAGKSF